ncbi:MAG: ribulose bisphosphate carboxylase small subunit, partial [Chroococcidiopsidaceae cyanobacterium CP_BM_RX_35]|nr:ribulose bisphosphate carboxylase small subunit [Chroococcidiopsidaceae cyanobacterium CP_BM_RX_35]
SKPNFNLPRLLEYGEMMVQEQQRVQNRLLVEEYNQAMRPGTRGVVNIAPTRNAVTNGTVKADNSNGFKEQATSAQLSPEILEQIRQVLAQDYRIGIEHVDERRFRTGSWKSYASMQLQGESEAIAALEACLAEYSSDYVRLVGIDPKAKRRVLETIIQRPGGVASR